MIFGISLISVGLYVQFSNFNKLIDIPWPIGIIVIGCFTFALTLFGCCGAIRESRFLLGLYFILSFIIVAAQLGVVVYIYEFDTGSLDKALSIGWDKADNSLKIWAENYFNCCGFNNDTDYPLIPCQNNATQDCSDAIKEYIDEHLDVVQIVVITIASIQLVGLLFSLCLCCVVPSEEKKRLTSSIYRGYNSTRYIRVDSQ